MRSWSPPSCVPWGHLETIDRSDHRDRLDRYDRICFNCTRLIKGTPNSNISLQKDNSAFSEHSCLAIASNSSSTREYHQRLCLEAWHVHLAHASFNRDEGNFPSPHQSCFLNTEALFVYLLSCWHSKTSVLIILNAARFIDAFCCLLARLRWGFELICSFQWSRFMFSETIGRKRNSPKRIPACMEWGRRDSKIL